MAVQVRRVLENKANDMRVELVAVPEAVTVINLDRIGELSGVCGPFRSRCDYLVLFREEKVEAAVFVELKKTLHEESRGLEQLRLSPPYLEYLKTICSIHFDEDVKRTRRVAIRYLLIGEQATALLPKQSVSDPQQPSALMYREITVRWVVGNRLRFDRLRKLVA